MALTAEQFSTFQTSLTAIFQGDLSHWEKVVELHRFAADDSRVAAYIEAQRNEAEIMTRSAASQDPNAFYRLGVCHHLLKKYSEAVSFYGQAVTLYNRKEDPSSQCRLSAMILVKEISREAMYNLAKKFPGKATQLYKQTMDLFTTNSDVDRRADSLESTSAMCNRASMFKSQPVGLDYFATVSLLERATALTTNGALAHQSAAALESKGTNAIDIRALMYQQATHQSATEYHQSVALFEQATSLLQSGSTATLQSASDSTSSDVDHLKTDGTTPMFSG
jgi:tetratricopeptide (TPR) repeat protein